MSVYYFRENLNALGLMTLTGVTMIVPILIIAPLISKMVKKFSSPEQAAGMAPEIFSEKLLYTLNKDLIKIKKS